MAKMRMKFPIFALSLFCLTRSTNATAESERFLVQDVVNVQIVGEVRQDRLSEWMDGAGDVNGDGYDDMIVSTHQFSNLEPDRDNYSYLIFGASDLPPLIDLLNTNVHRMVISSTNGAVKVAGIRDFNGDSRDDLALAVSNRDVGTLANIGEALIFFGTGSLSSRMNFLDSVDGVRIRGSKNGEYFGIVVESAGDFNGDGLGDVALLSFYDYNNSKRAVTVIYGSTDFPSLLTTADLRSHGTVIHHAFKYDGFGNEFTCAGDVNGDGFDDILIGADANDDGADRAYLIYGGTDLPPVIEAASLGKYGVVFEGGSNSYLGLGVSGVGDQNRDGYDDFMVSKMVSSPGGISKAGQAFILFGSKSLPGSINVDSLGSRGIRIQGTEENQLIGALFEGPADWNGDLYPDFALTPSLVNNEVFVVLGGPEYGSPKSLLIDAVNKAVIFDPDTLYGTFPQNIHFLGDINGDGLDDLGIANWFFNYGNRDGAGTVHIIYGGQFFETPTATPTPEETESPTPTVTVTPTPSFTPHDQEFFSGWILSGEGRVKITPERE